MEGEIKMLVRATALVVGLVAALLIAFAVSASAGHFRVSNTNYRNVWSSWEIATPSGTVRCPITIEGRFHSATFHKTASALVGLTTRATIVGANCTNGTATVNQESLPWHATYGGFTGMLPEITELLLNGINEKYTTRIGSLTCTFQTTSANPRRARVVLEEGVITGFRSDETARIPMRSSFFCEIAGEASFRGTGSATLLGTANLITLTLI
jgi:hypothetical protein